MVQGLLKNPLRTQLTDKTLFGEMTLYPASSYPDEYNRILGDYFVVPEKVIKA